jgi:hypothetical protein
MGRKLGHMPDEQPDLDLVAAYLDGLGLTALRFSLEETQRGPTPDFRLERNGQQVGFCEVKSPNDPWLDDLVAKAPANTLVSGVRRDPTFNRVSRHILTAGRQFDAVNPLRAQLNILAYVNHDNASHFGDLYEVLTGHFLAEGGERIPTMLHMAARLGGVRDAIDAYLWFDATTERLAGVFVGQTDQDRTQRTCDLLGIDPARLRRA